MLLDQLDTKTTLEIDIMAIKGNHIYILVNYSEAFQFSPREGSRDYNFRHGISDILLSNLNSIQFK